MTERRQKTLREKLRRSRARLMVKDADIALVLMYMCFVATKKVQRISTNGRTIYFDPDWLQKLDGQETDYILSHQVMHIVLEDTKRPAFFRGERYHHACDIIVASLLRGRGWHCDKLPHIGMLPHKTYFPGREGRELEPLEAFYQVPFDPAALSPGERRRYIIDSDAFWGIAEPPEDGTLILSPGYDEGPENIEEDKKKKARLKVTYGQAELHPPIIHESEDGEDAEDLPRFAGGEAEGSAGPEPQGENILEEEFAPEEEEDWGEVLDAAIDRLMSLIDTMDAESAGQKELLERIWKGVGAAKLEWRRLLSAFLQEEVNDYSFTPPDRRFDDSGFFLPDFNQSETKLRDVLFMVDSSGSVDDELIAEVYGEICAAIEQFDGALQGKLSFFDTQVVTPVPFSSVHQLLKIRPKGHGGTDFGCIFRYLRRGYEALPSCLVIFTDGRGEYPPEEEAMGIPVLWIISGGEKAPSWGSIAKK